MVPPCGEQCMAALLEALSHGSCSLPVPPIPEPCWTSSKSRRIRRRVGSARALWRTAERARQALNALWGEQEFSHAQVDLESPKRGRVGIGPHVGSQYVPAWRRLLLCSRSFKLSCRPPGVTGDCLTELMREPIDDYQRFQGQRSRYVPFTASRIAEPPPGSNVVDMLSLLPSHLASVYASESRMIRPGAEEDPEFEQLCSQFNKVLGPHSEWVAYLNRPGMDSLWELIPDGEQAAPCAVASVPKRDNSADRKILQICPLNWAAVSVDTAAGPGSGPGPRHHGHREPR